MRRRKLWVLGAILGASASALTQWMVNGNATAIAQQPKLPSNNAVQAEKNGIQAEKCAIALIDTALLAADRPGVLEYLELEDGDEVKAGEKVAGLKDGVARSALATAQEKARNDVQERYAEKATEFANKELEIANTANARLPGTVPVLEVQKLKLAAEKGVLQTEQAVAERTIAKLSQAEAEENLKTYDVYAPPYDCRVSKVMKKKGEAVRQGDPIIEVISTARVKVQGYVTALQSYEIKPGDPVEVTLDFGTVKTPLANKAFRGVVKFVDARVEGGKVMVTAYVKNENEILKDGLTARMTIVSGGNPGFRATR